MPALGLVGKSIAGGVVFTGSPLVTVNDLSVVIEGSLVASHGQNEHAGAVMVVGFPSVTCGDVPVCVVGSLASCGHPLICVSDVEVG